MFKIKLKKRPKIDWRGLKFTNSKNDEFLVSEYTDESQVTCIILDHHNRIAAGNYLVSEIEKNLGNGTFKRSGFEI